MVEGIQRRPSHTEYCTDTMAGLMKLRGRMNPEYRGLANYAVMSKEVKKFFIYWFVHNHGSIILVMVDTHQLTGKYMTPESVHICSEHPERRILVIVNDRHIVSARYNPEKNRIMVRDTSMNELPNAGNRLVFFLNETNILSPSERILVEFDTDTIQQPVNCGGCCVMSLANHLLPDDEYATIEDGERIRKEYGTQLISLLMTRRYTMHDAASLFDTLFNTEMVQRWWSNIGRG